MQLEQVLSCHLEDRGLFGAQTAAVVARVKSMPAFSTLHWSDDASGYPAQMLAAIKLNGNLCAIQWMDEECPGHFARSLFQ